MLKINDQAPTFIANAIDENGKEFIFDIKNYLGKNIVLYFYPKDDTPGCTMESCSFNDNVSPFKNKNTIVVGVSRDSIASHIDFQKKYKLGFSLVADTDTKVITMYDSNKSRNTFLIDEKGIIKYIWQNVSINNHTNDVMQQLEKITN